MPKTLLIADDSVVIQKLVGLSFANEEVDLVTTDNGDDAITMVRERMPDLVLADVVMPGKSGYEVCQAIKQDPELGHIPVLLLTGTFEAFDPSRAQEVSADGHITKPFEAQVLVDRVNELLSRPPASNSPSAAVPTSAPVPEADYDFFEDDTSNRGGESASDAGFGDALAAVPSGTPEAAPVPIPGDSPAGFSGDRTVAVMRDDPIAPRSLATDPITSDPIGADPVGPGPMASALIASNPIGVGSADLPMPHSSPAGGAPPAPPSDPGLTVLADIDFGDSTDPATPPPMDETILADDFSFEPTSGDQANSATPSINDDLFGDAPLVSSRGGTSNAFDFGTSEAPPEAATGGGTATSAERHAAPRMQDAAQPPGDAIDYSLDPTSRDPLVAAPPDLEPADLSLPALRGPDLERSALLSPQPDLDGSDLYTADPSPNLAPPAPDDLMDAKPPGATTPEPQVEPEPSQTAPQSDSGLPLQPNPALAPDLTPMIRERLHETLEKVAWEAFADISDTIVKQVIERVESIAWEVIPKMAETVIQEEIRRMKGESD